jgi:hypothetical protein
LANIKPTAEIAKSKKGRETSQNPSLKTKTTKILFLRAGEKRVRFHCEKKDWLNSGR